MGSVAIITGCPGSGKTTLARALAQAVAKGIHLDSDRFYAFPARFIDPTRPESRGQNRAILRAVGRAAGAFADEGYAVFVDGIVGPWFLPLVRGAIGSRHPIAYVLLDVDLATARSRVRERQGPGESTRVEHMHRAFARDHPYADHVVSTAELDPAAVVRAVERGLGDGTFLL
jgi:predicted kinase